MYYKEFFKNHQLPLVPDKYIKLESSLTNFFNVETTSVLTKSSKYAWIKEFCKEWLKQRLFGFW